METRKVMVLAIWLSWSGTGWADISGGVIKAPGKRKVWQRGGLIRWLMAWHPEQAGKAREDSNNSRVAKGSAIPSVRGKRC